MREMMYFILVCAYTTHIDIDKNRHIPSLYCDSNTIITCVKHTDVFFSHCFFFLLSWIKLAYCYSRMLMKIFIKSRESRLFFYVLAFIIILLLLSYYFIYYCWGVVHCILVYVRCDINISKILLLHFTIPCLLIQFTKLLCDNQILHFSPRKNHQLIDL